MFKLRGETVILLGALTQIVSAFQPSIGSAVWLQNTASDHHTVLFSKSDDEAWFQPIVENPRRSFAFSVLMSGSGAVLGPFLDSYHSAFGVLEYDKPIKAVLWGSEQFPALTTAWWVPGTWWCQWCVQNLLLKKK